MASTEKKEYVRSILRTVLYELTEYELDELDPTDSFAELGIDSYFTMRLSRALESEFQVKITYKQMVSEIVNLAGLTDFLAENAPDYAGTI